MPAIITEALQKRLQQLDDEGLMYQILGEIQRFGQEGIEAGRFTLMEFYQDLDVALWVAYANNNIDDYEHYVSTERWLKRVEGKAAGCGVWYYRYAVALLYLGRLEESLRYAEEGVVQEPAYPWGWLHLAGLRSHFGNQAGALEAIDRGLALAPGDYEFLRRGEEIRAGKGIEEMENHFIREEDDRRLLGADPQDALWLEKQRSIGCILCDEGNLEKIKTALGVTQWEPDQPYCFFTIPYEDYALQGRFEMNEAGVSKFSLPWILKLRATLGDLDENALELIEQKLGDSEGDPYILGYLAFFLDHSFALCYAPPSMEKRVFVFFDEEFRMHEQPRVVQSRPAAGGPALYS